MNAMKMCPPREVGGNGTLGDAILNALLSLRMADEC